MRDERHHGSPYLTYLSVDVGVRAVTQAGQVELPSRLRLPRRPVCRLRLSPHFLSLPLRRAGQAQPRPRRRCPLLSPPSLSECQSLPECPLPPPALQFSSAA